MKITLWHNHLRLKFVLALSFVLVGLLCLLPATPVFAQVDNAAPTSAAPAVSDLQAQADAIRTQIEGLNRDLEINVETHNATKENFQRLTQELADSRAQLDMLLSEQHAQEELLNDRLVTVYKSGDVNVLNVIMNSNSLSDFLDQTLYIARINEQDVKLEKQFKAGADEIADVTDRIDQQRSDQMQLERDLTDQQAIIESKIAERQTTLNQVDAQVKQILDQEAARRHAEQAKIAAEHQPLIDQLHFDNDLQRQVVLTALQYLGVPYVWGGESPSGFDCSGLTKYVFAQYGVELPHFAASQFNMGTPVALEDLQPGDLLFWGPGYPHHVAMYIGNNQYIEAPNFDEVVCVSTLVIDSDYAGARRYPLQPHA